MAALRMPVPLPFVGRDAELRLYEQLLAGQGFWLLLISGQSGNGKSELLLQFQGKPGEGHVSLLDFENSHIQENALTVAEVLGDSLAPVVDARSLAQFRQTCQWGRTTIAQAQIQSNMDLTAGAGSRMKDIIMTMDTGGALKEKRREVLALVTTALLDLAGKARKKRLIFLFDTFERLDQPRSEEVRNWLQGFLLRLHDRLGGKAGAVIAGREGLEALFPRHGTVSRRLGTLSFEELDRSLQGIGMRDAAVRRAIYEMTRGHPFCANMVAQVWQNQPSITGDLNKFQGEFNELAVTRWVLDRVLKHMLAPYDDLTRYGVILRSFDLPLLRHVFPELLTDPSDKDFRHLIGYAFTLRLVDGRYTFHDLLRQVQGDAVRRELPDKWNTYHRRALQYWQQEARRETIFKQQMFPPDYYYHHLALDEPQAAREWTRDAVQVALLGEREYWGRFLQAAHDTTLAPGTAFQAARAFHQGRFFFYQTQWNLALVSYQQAIPRYRLVGDCLGEANTLQAIGEVHYFSEHPDSALPHYQQALTLLQQCGDPGARLGEAHLLYAIGEVYRFRGAIPQALEQYRQAQANFSRITEREARLGEANASKALGDVYLAQQKVGEAQTHYQQALAHFRQLGSRLGEANTLFGIGEIQRTSNNLVGALTQYQEALTLFRQFGDHLGEANTLQTIGHVQHSLGNLHEAMSNYQQALPFAQQAGDRIGQAHILYAIGEVHQSWGEALDAAGQAAQARSEAQAALQSYAPALALYQQAKVPAGEANCYLGQGRTAFAQRQYPQALALQTKALELFQGLHDEQSQAQVFYYRSFTYEQMRQSALAVNDINEAVKIARRTQSPQLEQFTQRQEDLLPPESRQRPPRW